MDGDWLFIRKKGTAPKALSTKFSPVDWPTRSTLALTSIDGESDEWIALEVDYEWRRPSQHACVQYVIEPTLIATIYHPREVAMTATVLEPEPKVIDIVDVPADTPASDPKSPKQENPKTNSGASGVSSDTDDKPKPWVVSWAIDQDETVEVTCITSPVLHVENGSIKYQPPDLDYQAEADFIQAAISEERLEALTVANRWILDTGCGKDLIGLKFATMFQHYIRAQEQTNFNTASKGAHSARGLPIEVSAFQCESNPEASEADPYVMGPECPPVLSVGLRCMNRGFSFIWLSGMNPCLVTPDLEIIPLDVVGDIPYLLRDGLHTEGRDHSEIAALCGVRIDENNQLVICSEYLGRFMDAMPGEPVISTGPKADESVPESGRSSEKRVKVKGGSSVASDGETTDVPASDVPDLVDSDSDSDSDREGSRVKHNLMMSKHTHSLTHKPALHEKDCEPCM